MPGAIDGDAITNSTQPKERNRSGPVLILETPFPLPSVGWRTKVRIGSLAGPPVHRSPFCGELSLNQHRVIDPIPRFAARSARYPSSRFHGLQLHSGCVGGSGVRCPHRPLSEPPSSRVRFASASSELASCASMSLPSSTESI